MATTILMSVLGVEVAVTHRKSGFGPVQCLPCPAALAQTVNWNRSEESRPSRWYGHVARVCSEAIQPRAAGSG